MTASLRLSELIQYLLTTDAVPLSDAWKKVIDDAEEMKTDLEERDAVVEHLVEKLDWIHKQRPQLVTSMISVKQDRQIRELAGMHPPAEIARTIGRSETSVKNHAARWKISLSMADKRRWKRAGKDTLEKMRAEGKSWKEIGRALGRSPSACTSMYYQCLMNKKR